MGRARFQTGSKGGEKSKAGVDADETRNRAENDISGHYLTPAIIVCAPNSQDYTGLAPRTVAGGIYLWRNYNIIKPYSRKKEICAEYWEWGKIRAEKRS